MENKTPITVETTVKANLEKVWHYWNEPAHICNWYFASNDWHAPAAENDLRVDGKFKTTMAAKDGSMAFDFEGVYTNVLPQQLIEYVLEDGRKVKISFSEKGNETTVIETFDPENINSMELQKSGWQAILNNFKSYTETH